MTRNKYVFTDTVRIVTSARPRARRPVGSYCYLHDATRIQREFLHVFVIDHLFVRTGSLLRRELQLRGLGFPHLRISRLMHLCTHHESFHCTKWV